MNHARDYLRLSSDYCRHLGGVRWSAREDGLEYADGTTFAFTEEVAQFLEGFAAAERLPSFCFVVHLLTLLRGGRGVADPRAAGLRRAFNETGRSLRNAGAFFVHLCGDLPLSRRFVGPAQVLDRLHNKAVPIRSYVVSFLDTHYPAEVPPLGPEEFEALVLRRLEILLYGEVCHWLRHGRGPLGRAGEDLAREAPPPARTLTGALAPLLDRPRLAGARPFIDQMASVLTLPLRHPAPPEMPLGGYADVTTHGQPDRLLPSQFALDEWDFLRRFADRELLYFRREEPHAATRQELVAVLDQGVRAWGDVRLVLAAAVFALARQAERRKVRFLLAATGVNGELLDPLTAEPAALAEAVEASDLSASPALALERVLEAKAEVPREVVLLTHPRSLGEEEVRAAARRAGGPTRLFALALDGRGQAGLSELRHGVPVPLRQFRVDFTPAAPPPPPEPEHAGPRPWRGHVEPVPFPFRFGTDGPVAAELFDFDLEGRWLLTVSRHGLLHLWDTREKGFEVLPRPFRGGTVYDQPHALVGVDGGVVVVYDWGATAVAAHYHIGRRVCVVHNLSLPMSAVWQWAYSPEHHALIGQSSDGSKHVALDLGTGISYPRPGTTPGRPADVSAHADGGPVARARAAWEAWAKRPGRERRLPVQNAPPHPPSPPARPCCCLDTHRGELCLFGVEPAWPPLRPLADGRPALADHRVLGAQHRGDTLAVTTCRAHIHTTVTLRVFRGPPGVPLAEYAMDAGTFAFVLSEGGDVLARKVRNGRVEVRPAAGGPPAVTTFVGGFSPDLHMGIGPGWLVLRTGRHHLHLLRWDTPALQWRLRRAGESVPLHPASFPNLNPPPPPGGWEIGRPDWQLPASLEYDRGRFTQSMEAGGLTAAADRYGQVAVLDRAGRLVCLFVVFRDKAAGWLPDGTLFGSPALTGYPASPDAPRKFAEAFRRAAGEGTR